MLQNDVLLFARDINKQGQHEQQDRTIIPLHDGIHAQAQRRDEAHVDGDNRGLAVAHARPQSALQQPPGVHRETDQDHVEQEKNQVDVEESRQPDLPGMRGHYSFDAARVNEPITEQAPRPGAPRRAQLGAVPEHQSRNRAKNYVD